MSERAPGRPPSSSGSGFRAAIAEYPRCGMATIRGVYRTYAPILMIGDEELSSQRCEAFAKQARENGNPLHFIVYPGASHNFDDPSRSKRSIPANYDATQDAMGGAETFFEENLLSNPRSSSQDSR